MTIEEMLGKPSMTAKDKLALRIACEAASLVPTTVWAAWPSHSMDKWRDQVFASVLRLLSEHNFREAGK
jgi:hypothetical protein